MTREEREKALEVWYDITFDDKRFDEARKISIEALKAEPETGHCKECKWWKDKDGVYRRGIGAESSCPFNTKEIYDGDAYCYRFEPQETETWNGIHAQLTAPKGTFERIFNDADDDSDI